MEITDGGEETLLSKIRLCRMEIQPKKTLNMSGILHLTNGYLLEDEQEVLMFGTLSNIR